MNQEPRQVGVFGEVAAFLLAATLTVAPAAAQQVTGVPGSPSATTTITGKQLPAPEPKFGGVIKENAADSKTWWPPRIVPPKGAPNVLLIMTDDQGYGVSGTFGGVIPTPALDRVAKAGLRYTQFNSTALCSPTRAALITGRNHHSGGFGVITELSTGFPGYDSIIGADNATIGRVLKDNGVFFFEEIYPPLYANPLFRRILVHPRENRFYGPEFRAALTASGLHLLDGYKESRFAILGIAEKTGLRT